MRTWRLNTESEDESSPISLPVDLTRTELIQKLRSLLGSSKVAVNSDDEDEDAEEEAASVEDDEGDDGPNAPATDGEEILDSRLASARRDAIAHSLHRI